MQLAFELDDEPIVMNATPEANGWRLRLPDGSGQLIRARRLQEDILEIQEGSRTLRIPFARVNGDVHLSFGGGSWAFSPGTVTGKPRKKAKETGVLTAPMVGVVADVLVHEGQIVEAYQPLATLEAMKVLVTLEAPFAGIIHRLHVKKGDRVDHAAPVVEVIPATSAAH